MSDNPKITVAGRTGLLRRLGFSKKQWEAELVTTAQVITAAGMYMFGGVMTMASL